MGDDRFDEVAKAAAGGMSRRKVMKLLVGGGVAAALGRLRLGAAPNPAQPIVDSELIAARQAPTVGPVCAVLLSLVAAFGRLPFFGGIVRGLLDQFGCPGISGAVTCLADGALCDPNGSLDCCGVCSGGRCVAAVLPACCQCKDPLEELPARCCTITSIGCGPAEIIRCQSECRRMGYFSSTCTPGSRCPNGPVCFGGFVNGLCT